MRTSGTVERDTLDMLVVALCADYQRRSLAIKRGSVTHRTEMEYRYLNYKLYTAAAEIVGEEYAAEMIGDIGERRGYAKTELDEYSEKSYKLKKQMIKKNIAKRLHLVD